MRDLFQPERPVLGGGTNPKALSQLEYWKWWIVDEITGKPQTTHRMTREEAIGRFPKAEPVPGSMEIRNSAEPYETPGLSAPRRLIRQQNSQQ
jgi:hypothetical protein